MRRQCAALGVDPAQLVPAAAQQQAEAMADWWVWPEHWLAVQVFAAMATQWIVEAGWNVSRVRALDYPALDVVMTRMRVPKRKWFAVFDQVRVMEAEGLKVLNEG